MLTLYPEIRPYAVHRLAVDPPHELHLEESGNPDGIPVLFVHGGPGAGCQASNRCFFDPARYRIVLFDQRGAGSSTPHGELAGNDTAALIRDIESIRSFLGIERWVLFGGSWGSTLGLAYAEAFPLRVIALVLRGIFLCRREDLDWFYQEGASRVFPDHWQEYVEHVPAAERHELVHAYHRLLTGTNEIARMSAAKAWALWEAQCATLRPNHDVIDRFSDPHVALSLARIESHYFVNGGFLDDGQLLRDAWRIADVPGYVVHGRYDMICPVDNAFALHAAWPKAQLRIVRDAGHSAAEPGIIDALVRATREIATIESAG
ncbi:MAG: prolyl aminopeptidase [Pseudomonadales bacterium]|jgi:proline iminopeptidase|nr:prolyl aminopeptidase [Pseudomonadales bacterium]MCP5322222.1 prolyl aminopeptidase [Pseudomonadales bacterium]MCP5337108.1 prolyl aminopeptidase [Pseudomonadales bacterium]